MAADRALVVTTPEVSAIRDADRIIGLLEANDLRDIHLIINRLRPDMIARGDMMSVDDVTEILAVDLIGTLLDDEQIVIATNQGEPLSGKNSQAKSLHFRVLVDITLLQTTNMLFCVTNYYLNINVF